MDIQKNTYPFQKSCWIGYCWQVDRGGQQNRYYAFRKALELSGQPKDSLVYITADARYILWVNGQFVGRGPVRCFPDRQAYDEYQFNPFLKQGINWIAVLVHQFGTSTGQYIHRMRTGLILEGEITLNLGLVPKS